MKDLIEQLRDEHIKVTIHDMGEHNCIFVLAVIMDGPSTAWDAALIMADSGCIPRWKDNILFFPQLIVDAETYDFLCA
jgi:hypothetical protein